MILDTLLAQASVGAVGAVALELLHWYRLTRKYKDIRRFKRGLIYWLATAGMVALGALMPVLYLGGSASALLCFHLGAATPLLLQKLAAEVPDLANPQGAKQDGLRAFWSW